MKKYLVLLIFGILFATSLTFAEEQQSFAQKLFSYPKDKKSHSVNSDRIKIVAERNMSMFERITIIQDMTTGKEYIIATISGESIAISKME